MKQSSLNLETRKIRRHKILKQILQQVLSRHIKINLERGITRRLFGI